MAIVKTKMIVVRKQQQQQQRKKKTRTKTPSANAVMALAIPQPKRKSQPKARPLPRGMVERVCAITDPFCSAANGSKIYDDSAIRTLSYTAHSRTQWGSDAGGSAALIWHPQYSFEPFVSSSARVGSLVTAWSNFPSMSVTFSDALTYRMVSSGFIIRRVLAPLTAAGMLHIRSWPGADMSKYGTLQCQSYTASRSLDVAIQDVKELCVVTQRSSRPHSLFNNVADDSAIVTGTFDNGFTPITLYLSGAPASTVCFDIEYFINFEVVFDDLAATGLLASPPPPSNPTISAAAAVVTSSVATVFHASVKEVSSFVARKAATALASYVSGPLGGAIANRLARDVD